MSTAVPKSSSHMPQSNSASQSEPQVGDEASRLKYLDFVQTAIIYVVVLFSSLYECAKDNSGPLKPGVQTVEDAVKTVISPVYDKFHDLPFELLRFVDRKVDDSIHEVDHLVPSFLKQASTQARAMASEVQRSGPIDAAKNVVKSVEPVAEQYAVSAWRTMNKLPLFPHVAHVVISTAAYWAEKYNQAVDGAAERGYGVASVVPLIPMERIAKVFDGGARDVRSDASTSGHYD
ncbi:unnamed protein product [Rhodiola kirilowii]